MKIVILTGSESRHVFFRKAIAINNKIKVIATYCEGTETSLSTQIKNEPEKFSELQKKHIIARENSEKDFFAPFINLTPDNSKPIMIQKGNINKDNHVNDIINMAPCLLITYGCSLIKSKLLEKFKNRIINVHLGLSPYYRGSATNMWPMVNNELECIGATFLYMDPGIDTGQIIHQIRARIYENDTPHQIGNRLIADMVTEIIKLIINFNQLKNMEQLSSPMINRFYKRKDFNSNILEKMYSLLENNMITEYLANMEARCNNVPIIKNPVLI